ncbi:MAG: LytTR family transcriptional regulator DNA-binding domain-containing protein [Melioribacteraceae bacterium]|nr:LytTR family transcriptional regulator DNA-binding domain-containing protein [Melioribacteraceae bacterium]
MDNKIKALIVDDENLARDIVKNYLRKFPEIELIGECSNGFDALKQINDLSPDLIFLDIQMPKITGFEMLEIIENPPVIIFTTAFDQYALKAFEVNATDYLLKPFSEERFAEAIQKAIKQIENRADSNKRIGDLIKHIEKKEEFLERIVVKNGQKISIIPIGDVKYFEAQDDYVMIYTDKGNFLKQKTMKYFEENLDPAEFIRIHRSYIVRISNIKQIELFEKETYFVILNDGKKLPASKTGYQGLKEILDK